MKILVIDNYDSFTYNLVYVLRKNKRITKLDIIRNDKIAIDEVSGYDKILLSPGPGIPSEAGNMAEIINRYASSKSILGICLGHQGLGEAFDCQLENMTTVLHRHQDEIDLDESDYLFRNIGSNIQCGRYHSWRIKKSTLNGSIEVIATDKEGEIMGLRHKEYDIRGLQFHPESVLTTKGSEIINNWINK